MDAAHFAKVPLYRHSKRRRAFGWAKCAGLDTIHRQNFLAPQPQSTHMLKKKNYFAPVEVQFDFSTSQVLLTPGPDDQALMVNWTVPSTAFVPQGWLWFTGSPRCYSLVRRQ